MPYVAKKKLVCITKMNEMCITKMNEMCMTKMKEICMTRMNKMCTGRINGGAQWCSAPLVFWRNSSASAKTELYFILLKVTFVRFNISF